MTVIQCFEQKINTVMPNYQLKCSLLDNHSQASECDFITGWFDLVVISCLDAAFSLIMRDEGTLFSLFGFMIANFNQGLDDKFERVYIIIIEHQVPLYDMVVLRIGGGLIFMPLHIVIGHGTKLQKIRPNR